MYCNLFKKKNCSYISLSGLIFKRTMQLHFSLSGLIFKRMMLYLLEWLSPLKKLSMPPTDREISGTVLSFHAFSFRNGILRHRVWIWQKETEGVRKRKCQWMTKKKGKRKALVSVVVWPLWRQEKPPQIIWFLRCKFLYSSRFLQLLPLLLPFFWS